MIEKYFGKGYRIKWQAPKDFAATNPDGALIDNPPMVLNPMIYDGLDGELLNTGVNVTTLGLSKGARVDYDWLAYTVGNTTKKALTGDTLTGFMSGCLIATWYEGGTRYVGHVGTTDGRPTINNLVRSTFLNHAPPNVMGFNPAAAWGPGDIAPMQSKFKYGANVKIMALVTATGSFYSILMFKLSKAPGSGTDNYTWCAGGVKKIPSMNPAQIRTGLSIVAA